ncbi:MAG: hypothetical protein A4E40_00641 [Methanoregulaceae archaeon PtaU1.Bin059]|nr:MAG: hypothetical protein A4E39_01882 [Methanoregulaceae archaeon PtaB.Bin152]OPY41258.1 MAG: hypothetical protein A4E40_00641 [Methanoregulaceae archaeon PtaU1.Bin059]
MGLKNNLLPATHPRNVFAPRRLFINREKFPCGPLLKAAWDYWHEGEVGRKAVAPFIVMRKGDNRKYLYA